MNQKSRICSKKQEFCSKKKNLFQKFNQRQSKTIFQEEFDAN